MLPSRFRLWVVSFLTFCTTQTGWAFLVITPEAPQGTEVTPPDATCKLTMKRVIKDEKDRVLVAGASCSGTLIEKNLILTAAHCIDDLSNLIKDSITVECPKEKKVFSGIVATTPILYQDAPGKDFGLIRLSEAATQTQPMRVLTHPSEIDEVLERNQCFVAGYGLDRNRKSGKLLAGKMSKLKFESYNSYWVLTDSSQHTRVDHGDSGGTLYCLLRDGSAGVIGVTSSMVVSTRAKHPILDGLKKMLFGAKASQSETETRYLSVFAPSTTLAWVIENTDRVFDREDQALRSEAENWIQSYRNSSSKTLAAIKRALGRNNDLIQIPVEDGEIQLTLPPAFKSLVVPKAERDYELNSQPIEKVWSLGYATKTLIEFSAMLDEAIDHPQSR